MTQRSAAATMERRTAPGSNGGAPTEPTIPLEDDLPVPTPTEEEIELLIRARYPLLYLVSWEEQRVGELARRIAARRKKKLFRWSVTTGLVEDGASIQSQKSRNAATKDPLAALDHIIDAVEPAIYVLHDFHPFLKANNFAVIRRLKEIAVHLRSSYKTVLISSPVLQVPVELEKELTVIDVPLPGADELSGLLDEITREVTEHHDIAIDLTDETREQLVKAALGLTLTEAENVFAKILVNDGRLDADDIEHVFAEKRQILRKSGLLEYVEADERVGDVGGLDQLKDWLNKRQLALTDRAREFGLPAPKGVLLLGVQGCGKSLCAKAVSALWKMPLLRLDIGRMFGSLVGSSEENVRRAIGIAESVAPAILWLDELDKALAGAGGSGSSDGGTTSRVFSTILTWLSEKTSPVFVIATANDISQLPPELLRKGRFDEIFFVDLPGPAERADIAAIHLQRRGRDAQRFDLQAVARASEGFSGAEIEQAVIAALFDVFSAGKELETTDLLHALGQTVPLSRTMAEGLEELRQWARGRARLASSGGDEVAEAGGARRLEF